MYDGDRPLAPYKGEGSVYMRKVSARAICLCCLATVAFVSASRAGQSVVPSRGWPETAQLVLLGAGLSYVGGRLGKNKA